MTGSGVIDVTIGLVLVFFLLSLICSGLNEFLAGLFNMRGRFLTKSLGKILGDTLKDKLYDHPLIRGLSSPDIPTDAAATGPEMVPRKKPAYIPTKTFAHALQALLAKEAPLEEGADPNASPALTLDRVKAGVQQLPPALRDALTAVAGDVTTTLDDWRDRVEGWYEETMSRVSRWYKKQAKWFVLGFAILVTLALNADSVRIVTTLWRDKPVRDAIVARVQSVQDTPIPCPSSTADKTDPLDLSCVTQRIHDVDDLKLPLGYPAWSPRQWNDFPDDPRVPHNGGQWALKLLGLAITVAALSRGAPFWFDLLNRLANFRYAAAPPKKESKTS